MLSNKKKSWKVSNAETTTGRTKWPNIRGQFFFFAFIGG